MFQFGSLYSIRARLILHSDKIIYGEVLENDGNKLKVVPDGTNATNTYDRLEIRQMTFIDYKVVNNYWVMGLTFGLPSGFNIDLGYHFNPFGIQVTGLCLAASTDMTLYGIQVSFMYKIYEDEFFLHGISLITGYSAIKYSNINSRWAFGGVTYFLNWGIFYLDVGLTIGSGSYSNPQFYAQIGILIRFNRGKVNS